MGKLRATNIEPEGATTTLTLGASGDTVTVSSTQLRSNTFKDDGGNTLWTSDGSGTLSSINSGLSGGGMTLLSTATISDATLVSFGSSIVDSTYDEYWFIWYGIYQASNENEWQMHFSINNGTDWNTDKTTTFWDGRHSQTGGTHAYVNQDTALDQNNSSAWVNLSRNIQQTSGVDGNAGILKLYSPSNTTYMKQFMAISNVRDTSASTDNAYISGYIMTTSAVNAVGFRINGNGTITSGVIKAYGIS